MIATIDALISPTLKHLRERWWNDEFTEFLTETLRPRPGNRILDVGCSAGAGEVRIGRLHVSQLRLYGVDLKVGEAVAAGPGGAGHNIAARGDTSDPAVGATLPKLFAEHGIEPEDVRLFPVSHVTLGLPAADVWERR